MGYCIEKGLLSVEVRKSSIAFTDEYGDWIEIEREHLKDLKELIKKAEEYMKAEGV